MFNWVNCLNFKVILIIFKNTLSLIVFDRKVNAIPEKVDNPPTYFFANSLHKTYKLEKGESKTKQPI